MPKCKDNTCLTLGARLKGEPKKTTHDTNSSLIVLCILIQTVLLDIFSGYIYFRVFGNF